jgi:hypothetical protein
MQLSPWKGLVERPGWYQCDREVMTGLEDNSEHHTRRRENLKSHIVNDRFVRVKHLMMYIPHMQFNRTYFSTSGNKTCGNLQPIRRAIIVCTLYKN